MRGLKAAGGRGPGWPMGIASLLSVAGLSVAGMPAAAQVPQPWQMGLQAAHSPVQSEVVALNTFVLYIIIGIVVFIAALMLYVFVKFNHRAHPIPTRTSHNTVIEILWTTVPVLILIVIAVPSFRLVYFQDRATKPDMTVKVTGHQWYWEYTYPEQGGLDFQSYMIPEKQLKPEQRSLRQLAVDNPMVVPVGKNVRVLIASGDVLHSFFLPALGVQRYAIPGRLIETWFKVDKPGDYYGECNQICGINHSAMSIEVHAVSEADYADWLKTAKNKFSALQPLHRDRVELAAAR